MSDKLTMKDKLDFPILDYTLHDAIARRRSPKGFVEKPIEPEHLRLVLEAARWAPSSRNEQPWRFIVADKFHDTDEFEKLLSTLSEANRAWASQTSVLIAVVAKTAFSRDGLANRHAAYDVGGAVANLTVQAVSLGLQVHQMAGFMPAMLREVYRIPPEFEPMAVLALGYPDDSTLGQRQRVRKELSELVFRNEWGKSITITNA
jgi:nitroreductase